jgi:hypothetical protein
MAWEAEAVEALRRPSMYYSTDPSAGALTTALELLDTIALEVMEHPDGEDAIVENITRLLDIHDREAEAERTYQPDERIDET